MEKTKRYNVYSGDIGFINWNVDEKGQWVKFSDHESTIQELKDRIKKLEETVKISRETIDNLSWQLGNSNPFN